MSENSPIGLAVIEKIFGLVLIIIGAIAVFFFSNPPAGDVSYFASIFTVTGFVVIASGVLLLITKTE
jgi:protein-S-isoprenylcysteine O-methyltransferase Ste14